MTDTFSSFCDDNDEIDSFICAWQTLFVQAPITLRL